MLYRIFNNQTELDEANARWLAAKEAANVHDICNGIILQPCITTKWDDGKLMTDGRIACCVPSNFAEAFAGLELDLTDEDFPEITINN